MKINVNIQKYFKSYQYQLAQSGKAKLFTCHCFSTLEICLRNDTEGLVNFKATSPTGTLQLFANCWKLLYEVGVMTLGLAD